MTILVTGATGFLGRQLTATWVEVGRSVRGLVRPGSDRLPSGTDTCQVLGLDDREGLRKAVASAHAVVHLAARVHVVRERATDPMSEFRRINVDGTRILLEESVRAGVRQFVFISSVKAVGESNERPWTESEPPRPIDPYGISKWEAEQVVTEIAAASDIQASILRLPLVYGPGVGANMYSLVRAVARGIPLPFAGVTNRRSLAYSRNVVAAIDAVLASPDAGGETFFVSDGEDVSTEELIRRVAAGLGRPARLFAAPWGLLRVLGRVGDRLDRLAPVPLTTSRLDRLTGSLCVSIRKLEALTGFVPPHSMREGLNATAQWFLGHQSAGLIPHGAGVL